LAWNKIRNLTNAPKTRSIEDFWGILKCMLRIGLQKELKRKVDICLKEIGMNPVQSIAGSFRKRLDTVQRKGYDAL